MQIEDLIGKYQIIGTNQDDTGNTYKGVLFLSLREDNSINAKWIITRRIFKNNYNWCLG